MTRLACGLAAVLFVATCVPVAEAAAPVAPAPWEQALRELDAYIHQLSLINLSNGLRLTREQATKLLGLVRQVDAVAPPQVLGAEFPPDLDGCRKTYAELRDTVMKGAAVSPELERRVVAARGVHSQFVRATLLAKPRASDIACTNCHDAPPAAGEAKREPMTVTPEIKKQMDLAHIVADYGWVGTGLFVKVAPEVDAIVGEGRRAAFAKYSCCLVPPSDMADPVRIGQAESSEKELELLRGVRKIPAADWPAAREAICRGMDFVTELVSPGATAEKKAAAREAAGKAMDRALELGDAEFELDKENLAKAIGRLSVAPQDDWPQKAAFFLLIPGSSGVYQSYIERLAKEEGAK
ncbi:MAG: hypothetical protein NT049_16895 [Planctomycetota bacterium]|nr:hypothetical protein [Planctomycetota bacterium]